MGYVRSACDAAIILSDTHCGSVVGLCPPDFAAWDGGTISLNPIQAWIWDTWQTQTAAAVRLLKGRRWALVLNGDLIEGSHHRNGPELSHSDPGVHVRIAVAALAPLARHAAEVYVTRGTPCHVGTMSEAAIGDQLGAVRHPESREASAFYWLVDFAGCRVAFRHHIGTTGRIALAGTQLSVQLAEEQTQAARFGLPIPSVCVRSHRHVYGRYDDGRAMAITTPAWQALTPYGHKVVPASVPALGLVVMRFGKGLPEVTPMIEAIGG